MNLELIRKSNLMKQKYKQSFNKIKIYKITKKEIELYCKKTIEDYKKGYSETTVCIKESNQYHKGFALEQYERYLRKNRISVSLIKKIYLSKERKWELKFKFINYNGGIEWSV